MDDKVNMCTIHQELTEKDLPQLKGALDVHKVFCFLTRLSVVEQSTIYPVYIAKHMSATIRTVLEDSVQMYRDDKFYAEYHKLKDLDTKRILYGGVQNLTNVEIYKLLRWEIRPLTKAQMKQALMRSVYPANWYTYFEDEEKIRMKP